MPLFLLQVGFPVKPSNSQTVKETEINRKQTNTRTNKQRPNRQIVNHSISKQTNIKHGLVVMGEDSCSKGCGFKSQHHILDGHFSHIFVVKIGMLEKTKINEKGVEDSSFLNRHSLNER